MGPRARGCSVKRGGASGPCPPAVFPESYGSSASVLRCPQMVTPRATLVGMVVALHNLAISPPFLASILAFGSAVHPEV